MIGLVMTRIYAPSSKTEIYSRSIKKTLELLFRGQNQPQRTSRNLKHGLVQLYSELFSNDWTRGYGCLFFQRKPSSAIQILWDWELIIIKTNAKHTAKHGSCSLFIWGSFPSDANLRMNPAYPKFWLVTPWASFPLKIAC